MALLTTVLYGHTLPFAFVFDDCVYLTENPFAFGDHRFGFLTDPRGFATAPARMGMDPDFALNIMLRPFGYFTFYVNYLWGGLDPRGFRLVNLVIHGANAWLVFLLLRHLLVHSRGRPTLPESSRNFIPLAAAALFAVHPLHTESVTYVIQRFTSMGTMFCLLTTLLHFLANDARSRMARVALRAGSLGALVLGMLTKESAVMAPAMIVLFDWIVMGSGFRTALRRALPLLACMVIVPGLVLFTTWAENDGHLTLGAAVNIANRDDVPRSHYAYILTSLRVIVGYLRLIVLPMDLNLDPKVEWSTSLTDGRVLLSAAGLIVLIAGAWLIHRRRPRDLRRSMIFAFTVYFFGSLVVSSGLVPLPDAMAEHRTYKGSIGALVVLVILLDLARTRFFGGGRARLLVPGVTAVWVLVLAAGTLARNEVWRTPVTLWSDTVEKSPGKWRPLINLGAAYAGEGRLFEAETCFRKVLLLEPRVIAAYSNLASVLNEEGNHGEALEVCARAAALGIGGPEFDFNVGFALCGLGRVREGIAALQNSLALRPGYRPAHVVLGMVYDRIQRDDLALKHYRHAAVLGPEDPALTQVIRRMEDATAMVGSDSAAQ